MNPKKEKIATNNVSEASSRIVEELLYKADPSELFGRDGLFQQLKKQIVEKVLSGEMDYDLWYSKHSKISKADDNRRNGNYEKTIIDDSGHKVTIEVPRDRDGEFTPKLVPKGVRRFSGFDDKVISLYGTVAKREGIGMIKKRKRKEF